LFGLEGAAIAELAATVHEAFLDLAGEQDPMLNFDDPLAPTFEEALAQTLTASERDRFEEHARAVLASGTPARRTLATAYLLAIRP